MFFKSAIRTAARRATRLIVPSNATRDELVRVLSVDPARIDVAYHGVDHRLFHRPDPHQVSQVSVRLGLHGKPYIAFLGSLEPRKNVAALIRGWAGAVADLADPPALVLGGGGGWSDEVDAAVSAVPPHLRLCRPGYLPFADLPGFLGGALVVAFPSRGEGFGLPVLEAMACGAPVLTTHMHVAARGRRRGGRVHGAGRGLHQGRPPRADRRPGAARRARRRGARAGPGVHLGGIGRGASGQLQAGGRPRGHGHACRVKSRGTYPVNNATGSKFSVCGGYPRVREYAA